MSRRMLQITLLADEWKSSKGGLSTMNRELAIQLAKRPNVTVTFLVPKCSEADKKAARSHNIRVVEAKERPGFPPVDWLCFPPKDLGIDIIVGHGVRLGKQAQVIRDSHNCVWMQVVHTAPEELAMFKTYSNAISKGDEKQWTEVRLCEMANVVVAVGPKLHEFYSAYLSSCDKHVFNLTPGIFTEFSTLKLSTQGAKKFRVLVFGRGDSEDFELKGFDIAAKAVAKLNDRSYHLTFVGAPSGKETQVRDKLLKQGLHRSQLIVKGYLEREYLAKQLCASSIAIIPSRTEGFGLTALEALSAGLPFLVSQNSGFGEALQQIPSGSSWIVDSEEPEQWTEAIQRVRLKGRETALQRCQELRTRYSEKYSWEKQCNDLVEMMVPLIHASEVEPSVEAPLVNRFPATNENSEGNTKELQSLDASKDRPCKFPNEKMEHLATLVEEKCELAQSGRSSECAKGRVDGISVQSSELRASLHDNETMTKQRRERSLFGLSSNKGTAWANSAPLKRILGGVPKEIRPSSAVRTKPKGRRKLPQQGMAKQPEEKHMEGKPEETTPKQKLHLPEDQFMAEQRLRTEGDLSWTSNSSEERTEESSYNNSNMYTAEQRTECSSLTNSRSVTAKQNAVAGSFRTSKNLEQKTEEISNKHSNTAGQRSIEGSSLVSRSDSPEQRTVSGSFKTFNSSKQRTEGSSNKHSNNAEPRFKQSSSFTLLNSAEQRVVAGSFKTSNRSKQRTERSSSKHSNNAEARLVEGSLFSPSNSAEQRPVDGSIVCSVSGTDDSFYTKTDLPEDHAMKNSEREMNPRWNEQIMQQPQSEVTVQTVEPRYPPTIDITGERVMLESRLSYGRISYRQGDIKILQHGFKVPDLINDFLLGNYGNISEAEVRILSINGDENQLRCSVDLKSKKLPKDEGSQFALNEVLKLKTRLRYGKVSFEKDDLEFNSPDFEISQYVKERLERKYWAVPNCELCLVIDTKGNLTPRVQMEIKHRVDAIFNTANTVWKIISN